MSENNYKDGDLIETEPKEDPSEDENNEEMSFDESIMSKEEEVAIETYVKSNPDNEISGELVIRTGKVAEILGVTPGMVGFYCRQFEQNLPQLRNSDKEHRMFNAEAVKRLVYIKKYMEKKNQTVEQAKRFFAKKEGKQLLKNDNSDARMLEFLDIISDKLEKKIDLIVEKKINEAFNSKMPMLMEESITKFSENVNESNSKLERAIEEAINKKLESIEGINKSVSGANENLDKVMKSVENLDSVVNTLRDKLTEKQSQQEKEKKSFWSRLIGN